MKWSVSSATLGVLLTLTAIGVAAQLRAQSAPAGWKAVEQALGKDGQPQPGDVFRVDLPRTDLKVKVRDVDVKPALALGSYAVFKRIGGAAMVMGDLVLLDAEVNPVMSRLLEDGLTVTALHNHLNDMSPHVMYLHFAGRGNAGTLAEALRYALAASRTPIGGTGGDGSGAGPTVDTRQIEQILGYGGKPKAGGVFGVSVPRAEKIRDAGMELPPAMGVASAFNFQPTGEGEAALTGDFVLVAREVNPVARTLREHGIEVTAIHNHGLGDEPRLFYMHFWAHDDAAKLARGLHAALEKTNSAKSAAAR